MSSYGTYVGYSAGAVRDSLRLALQRALDLIEVVVVVPRHERQEAVESDPAAHGMEPALVPLGSGELAEDLQRFLTTLAERRQRLRGIVAQVLALLGHAVGVGA